jgi:hypothetical protein
MAYRPLFIFGLARSGTNLLARMLDRHPSVSLALDPLMPLFRSLRNAMVVVHAPDSTRQRFSPASPFQDYYFDPDGAVLLDLMLAAPAALPFSQGELAELRGKVAARASLESPALGTRMQGLAGSSYGALFRNALDIIAGMKPGAAWVGSKEVWALEFLPFLARAFPDAHFYVLERDPRAIVASLLAMAERDPTQAAHPPSYLRHWRKQVALVRRFEKDAALSSRVRCLSFEQLATAPQAEAQKLCQELGIDYITEMLHLSADGWMGNSSFQHGGRDVYAGTIECWRQALPEPVVQAADYFCGPEMSLTRYQPASTPDPATVLAYLQQAAAQPGSWRSDSGDLLADFGGEMLRRVLTAGTGVPDEDLARRGFLFHDTLDAIRYRSV